MRISSFLAFAGAATLSLSALAAPSIAPSAAIAHGAPVQKAASSAYRLSRDDARHMRGAYLLGDGRTVTVTSEGSKLFADLDGKREELVRVGWAKFVTRDSGAGLAFNRLPYADEVVVDQAAR
jgi:hypothetical protein